MYAQNTMVLGTGHICYKVVLHFIKSLYRKKLDAYRKTIELCQYKFLLFFYYNKNI